jgi:hypothetical protein
MHVADDGLTVKCVDALEVAFKASSSFVLSGDSQAKTLVVSIPTNLSSKRVGDQLQVMYSVELSSGAGQHLATSTGSCWDEELSKCADVILRDAEVAARRMP